MEYAKTSLSVEKLTMFKGSPSWLDKVLKRNGKVEITLHGEKHEISDYDALVLMTKFRDDLGQLLEKHGIEELNRVYN
jgi:hypothetical protein